MTYSEKLKDPRWQRRRLEIMQRDDFTCLRCEEAENTLHVHHLYYVSGREPWDYPLWSYQTLCEKCHKETREIPENLETWEILMDSLVGREGFTPNTDFYVMEIGSALDRLSCHPHLAMDAILGFSRELFERFPKQKKQGAVAPK
jgi:hypothetical protein